MDDTPPLGALAAFKKLTAPRAWGPDNAWTATFGGRVVLEDLISGLRAHPQAVMRRFSAKAEAYPVILGCVPWLDSPRVVDALLKVGTYCVIVDKGAWSWQCDRLLSQGAGVPQKLLRGLETWAPAEGGRPPVIGPYSRLDRELEPVRVAGWNKPGERPPLLHAKLAVCCAAWRWEGEMGGTDDLLTPMRVWMGSANWTRKSAWHLEFGAWSADTALASAALEFMTALVKISEPFGTEAERPRPQLVAGEWDDEAFAEVLGDMELDEG